MMKVSRLSAMPLFLRNQDFWNRILDPLAQVGSNARYGNLRVAAATHRWALEDKGFGFNQLSASQLALIDVAQSMLERGTWTLPSWRVEQFIAERVVTEIGWSISQEDSSAGSLAFTIDAARPDAHFQSSLVTARWACEVGTDSTAEIWNRHEGEEPGSDAERRLFDEVLVPVLGFPLLDYLRLQPELLTMGLDPLQFASQRADFCIDTGRGLKLVIEVDGSQHVSDAGQKLLDVKRDEALAETGWSIWRIPTYQLADTETLKDRLKSLLSAKKGVTDWGVAQRIQTPRSTELLSCVWGATVTVRIQFLLLEALRHGLLLWDQPWRVCVLEADTAVGKEALEDIQDWFGRLREMFGESPMPDIIDVPDAHDDQTHIVVDVSVIQPHRTAFDTDLPIAWSRPANQVGIIPKRRFQTKPVASKPPSVYLVESFAQDLLRKSSLREGQYEIICRILAGQDVIGLLPTGGGKSLTYQLCGLLLGGLTVYVSPLKSLLQDQRERFWALGVDLVQEISSALSKTEKLEAGQLLTAGGVRFLLIAPERFLIDNFRLQLAQFRVQFGEVCQVVIDECHCVSEWGHDFRPAYLSLSRIVKERTKRLEVSAPLVALTGTASSIVLADVKRELGVLENAAIVRAKRLDRPEIEMTVLKLRMKEKSAAIQASARDFLVNTTSPRDGCLVFSRFIGGVEGVVGVTASLMGMIPHDNLRFYTGSAPKWKQFAAFATKRKTRDITDSEALNVMPPWALSPENGRPLDWERVKSKVQSDFISGLPGNYQVLIATNAFGMGIDKPSIRRVVHYMTPQSPEAYYQEVGRAGRDKKSSAAILLFSDEEPTLTDKILDPGASIDEVRKIYQDFTDKNKFQGGDFIRTFYFHQKTFSGPDEEVKVIALLLSEIRRRIASDNALVLDYIPDNLDDDIEGPNAWRTEKNIEYGLVRLIILGVVGDYTKDYNKKQFHLLLAAEWEAIKDIPQSLAEYYTEQFRKYAQRYQRYIRARGEEQILTAVKITEIEAATAKAVVDFVYEQVERKRRQASRQMLEFARVGVNNPAQFREKLNLFLQVSEKFTRQLEEMVEGAGLGVWKELLAISDSPDETAELHGACQRVLESYPTHPGLLAISAVTRLKPTKDGLKRSVEELKAALRYAGEIGGVTDAKNIGEEVAAYVEERDEDLTDSLHGVYGLWLLNNGERNEAIKRFFIKESVRDYWLRDVLRDVRVSVPALGEL